VIGLALGYALVAAAANVVGALAVVSRRRWSVHALASIVALAAGFMLSVAMLELVPEAIERGGAIHAPAWILGSYLLVHLTQHTLAPHFHFGEETHEVTRMVGASALIGLLMHTFVDGVAIASASSVSASLGFLVFVAILLHKLPEGLAISSLFLAAGASRRAALAAAAALGAATIAGVVLTSELETLGRYGLALSAGVTLYVAASNLVPEFQRKGGWRSAGWFFGGCAIYAVARAALRV
jgi:ZIP family zinc transporter/zinc and cadmium transporter